MPPEVSVVVPAYDEGRRLGPSLERIVEHLRRRGAPFEVLVVDDGSDDDTVEVARSVAAPEVLVLSHGTNRGKGAAVRTGALASRGERVLLTDADLSTPIAELDRLEPHLERAHLVLGSRAVAESKIEVHQPFYREFMGKTFNRMIRLAGVRGIADTQCGFKLLRGPVARDLFRDVTVDGFAYDVELVWLALRRGLAVAEVGVTWLDSRESKVHPLRDPLYMLRDVLRIRWRHRGERGGGRAATGGRTERAERAAEEERRAAAGAGGER